MAVELLYHVKTTVKETLAAGVDAAAPAGRVIVHDQFDTGIILNAGTTPAATKVAAWTRTIANVNEVIDLTALTGAGGAALDATGLRVRAFFLRNTGANTVTLSGVVTNGYLLLGSAWLLAVVPGGILSYYASATAPLVGATSRYIVSLGTVGQTYDCMVVFG
jgi:hypothetical protein